MYLQLERYERLKHYLNIEVWDRATRQRKAKRERECFGNSTDSLKPSRFSWAQYPVSLLRYLHTKPIKASSAAADLSPPRTREKRRSRSGLIWVPGIQPENLFSNQTVDGNRGWRPKLSFPQFDRETQGPGAKKPRELWCNFSHWHRARYRWRDRERQRKRVYPVQRDPSEGSFSSKSSLQRPRCALRRTRQLPVPTVEYQSTGRGLGSCSDPEDLWNLSRNTCNNSVLSN